MLNLHVEGCVLKSIGPCTPGPWTCFGLNLELVNIVMLETAFWTQLIQIAKRSQTHLAWSLSLLRHLLPGPCPHYNYHVPQCHRNCIVLNLFLHTRSQKVFSFFTCDVKRRLAPCPCPSMVCHSWYNLSPRHVLLEFRSPVRLSSPDTRTIFRSRVHLWSPRRTLFGVGPQHRQISLCWATTARHRAGL